MDRSWIELHNRTHKDYIRGVKEFLNFAIANSGDADMIRCPCSKCNNCVLRSFAKVRDHLFVHGMSRNYYHWVHHGEIDECIDSDDDTDVEDGYRNMELDDDESETMDILHDLWNSTHVNEMGEGSEEATDSETDYFSKLFVDAGQELYPGSKGISKLSFVMKLLHLKLLNTWSNKSFDMLLQFLMTILPSNAHVPKSYYECKKIIRELGMKYEKIDVCKNDCILFWNDLKEAEHCPVCGLPRFHFNEKKGKKIPFKILRYFPLKPRLQRLFVTATIAEDMRRHEDK